MAEYLSVCMVIPNKNRANICVALYPDSLYLRLIMVSVNSIKSIRNNSGEIR